ncbi:MAG: hypothetical protein U9O98_02810, partial [Asgard group archaeon]|nr:hypothetical protein [Asgard group archaeon]
RKLLKVAFEREFMTRDEFLESTLSQPNYLERLKIEIAEAANINQENIYIDIPTLPSVPYSHSIDLPAYQIPMFQRVGKKQEKRKVKLQEVSRIFEALIGMLYIFRVYTFKEHREIVKKATEKIFGKKSIEKQISF